MGAIEDKRRYRERHRERINAERRAKRKTPEAREKEKLQRRSWRAKTKWERKLVKHLGVSMSEARQMVSASV
jgi:hypothetical protein